MATEQVQEIVADYDPEEDRPLGGYATLMGVFLSAAGGFAAWVHHSGRELPERVGAADLALITMATHKASRLIAKDRVASAVRAPFTQFEAEGGPAEVQEHARGSGLRRVLGELLTCPYCLSMWIAAALIAGLSVAPRPTRWVASVLTADFGSDVLQVAYKKLQDAL